MQINLASISDKQFWASINVKLPQYNCKDVAEKTLQNPTWLHFGAGNIFRGYLAVLQQKLLDAGFTSTGIIAAETFDFDILDKIYTPHNNLGLVVTLNPNGTTSKEIVASVAQALKANPTKPQDWGRLCQIFENESLQMASLTITEKGYALCSANGSFLPSVLADMENGPQKATHAMAIIAALLHVRFLKNAKPIAVLSMDNCSHNGEKLQNAVISIAKAWQKNAFVSKGFLAYLKDESKVSFPFSMIDKITPRPHPLVQNALEESGLKNIAPIVTSKGTYVAAFVNAEKPEYLVVEDKFPNGRPLLEKVGVYFTKRETVNKCEKMKVCACLNPLHTAMSVYGCLLGHTLISKEMEDPDILALICRLGYKEGLPVLDDPEIIDPKQFLEEVLNQRLPNPFMPDAPQRIATDTSQKVGIRFGETIKSHIRQNKNLDNLLAIPLAIAGWFRYLLAVDDQGQSMHVSSDPLKEELQTALYGIVFGKAQSYCGQLRPLLAKKEIFGLDLSQTALAGKIEELFISQIMGVGAVRKTLHKTLIGCADNNVEIKLI